MEKESDGRFLDRLKIVGEKYGVEIWTMAP
jgi:hypothetical protein